MTISISFILAAILLTPANRGRFTRMLSQLLSKEGNVQMQAASVASLLGGRSAATTLAMGSERFRALPLGSLTREELANSTPDPALFNKTVPAKIDHVEAFVSHSWSDDGNAKFSCLSEWSSNKAAGDMLIWLDKVRT